LFWILLFPSHDLGGNNNTSIGGLDIKGYAYNDFQAQTDIFAVSYGNGSTVGDSINYKGKTDGNNNIQNKASMDAAITSAVNDIGNVLNGGIIQSTGGSANNSGTIRINQTSLAGSGEINIFNSDSDFSVGISPGFGITFGNGTNDARDFTIFFDIRSSNRANFQVRNSGKFHWKDQENDFMTLNAADLKVFSPAVFEGSSFTVERGAGSSSNTTNFRIEGMLTSGGSTTSALVDINRSSINGDTMRYYGLTNSNNSIQTKTSVTSLIENVGVTTGTWSFINKSSGTGSTIDGFYLVEYIKNTDEMVTVLVDAEDSTDNLGS